MKFLLFLLFLGFNLVSYTQTYKINIIHINDVHAKIENFPKLSAYIDDCKKDCDTLFVFSAGDLFSGNPIVDQNTYKGYPIIDLMNKTNFIASAIGNHEFDYGQEGLNTLANDAKFKFLCMNINTDSAKFKNYQEKLEIDLPNNLKIVVSGIIHKGKGKYGIPESHPDKVKGINFLDERKTLQKFIKENNNYDLFILLSHLGLDKDSLFAKKLTKPDIIIGGHTHDEIFNTTLYKNTLTTQAGHNLEYIGKISLEFDGKKLINENSELISCDSLSKFNRKLQRIVEDYNNNEKLNEVLNILPDSISGLNELGSLMTDAVTNRYSCDVAFQNNGGIRLPRLEKGEVKVKDIYTLDPFGNNVYVYEMTIKQIKSLIEFSYLNKGQSLLQVSGLKYTVIANNKGKLKNILISDYNNNLLEDSKTFKVGLNSYIASTYKFRYNKRLSISRASTAELLIQYIRNSKILDYKGIKRAEVKTQ